MQMRFRFTLTRNLINLPNGNGNMEKPVRCGLSKRRDNYVKLDCII